MRGSRPQVAIGGALGSVARVGVGAVVPATPYGWPVATLLVNVSGALLLAVVVARVRHPGLRALLGTGFLGAWTTFSTFTVEVEGLLRTRPVVAAAYAAASVLAGLVAVRIGRRGAGGVEGVGAGGVEGVGAGGVEGVG